ncbi:hypothetical protein YB2330_005567 [Saitoella coloradoensis]
MNRDETGSRGYKRGAGNERRSLGQQTRPPFSPRGSGMGQGGGFQQQSSRTSTPGNGFEQHISVKGFNGAEVSGYLNRGYEEMVAKANGPAAEGRPEIYKSPSKGWTTKGSSGGAWGGSRSHLTAKGTQFMSEVKKSAAALEESK